MATVSLQVQTSQSSFMSLPPVLGGKKQREINFSSAAWVHLCSQRKCKHTYEMAALFASVCSNIIHRNKRPVECVPLSLLRSGAAGHARASAMLLWWMGAGTDWELFYIISWLCKVLIRHEWGKDVMIYAAAELLAECRFWAAEARRSRTVCERWWKIDGMRPSVTSNLTEHLRRDLKMHLRWEKALCQGHNPADGKLLERSPWVHLLKSAR